MSKYNIILEDWEYNCFKYLMKDEDINGWLLNFAKERARKASVEILSALIEHCNKNEIALEVGKAAQIEQAFELGVIKTALQKEEESK